jgi:glycosyltransferase involved in cell wall biosynthesis
VAAPSDVSVVIPAFNEAGAIGDVVRALRDAAAWREILVIDDGSSDDTAGAAEAAGARVLRQPYNKGNGAAVKTGIRHATGDFVLVIDADGQHPPADAIRLAARLGEYDLVVGARTSATQAGVTRRLGNSALNRLASFLTEREIPDLTSGFRGARREHLLEFLPLLPNGFSTPTTTTLAFVRAGYNVAFEPVEARDDDLQSAAGLRADRGGGAGGRRRLRRLDDHHPAAHHQLVGPAHPLRGGRLPRGARLGADLRAPLRWTQVAAGMRRCCWRPQRPASRCASPSASATGPGRC